MLPHLSFHRKCPQIKECKDLIKIDIFTFSYGKNGNMNTWKMPLPHKKSFRTPKGPCKKFHKYRPDYILFYRSRLIRPQYNTGSICSKTVKI